MDSVLLSLLLNADASANFLGSTLYYFQAGTSYVKGFYTGLGTSVNTAKSLTSEKIHIRSNIRWEFAASLVSNSFLGSGQSDNFGASSLANAVIFAPVFLNEIVLRWAVSYLIGFFTNNPTQTDRHLKISGKIFISVHTYSYNASGAVVFELGSI